MTKAFRFDLCTFLSSGKLSSHGQQKNFTRWVDIIHQQPTIFEILKILWLASFVSFNLYCLYLIFTVNLGAMWEISYNLQWLHFNCNTLISALSKICLVWKPQTPIFMLPWVRLILFLLGLLLTWIQKNTYEKAHVSINGWQLAKMKKSIPDMSLSWNL